jgi:hypothetical protein
MAIEHARAKNDGLVPRIDPPFSEPGGLGLILGSFG